MALKIVLIVSLYCTICINSQTFLKDVNDFKWLTAEPYFIDKTEMLTLIFDEDNATSSNNSYHFISCPFNFGKRKNLYMIQDFAGIEVDKNGKPKIWLETEAVQIFMNLSIGKHPYLISKHLARYPIILMDLSVSKKNPLNDIPVILNDMLRKALHEYKWLHNILRENFTAHVAHSNVDEQDAKFFIKAGNETLTEKELDDGLFRVAKFLHGYFKNHKVILLIDEYENVALHAVTSNNQNAIAFYEKFNKMLIRVLNDGSEYIEKVVITGTGSMAFSFEPTKFSLFGYSFGSSITKRDFITHHVFLDDHPFTPYFGFLENDLIELHKLYGSKDHEKNTIKKLYNGYLTKTNRTMIYNPSNIARFFQLTYHPRPKYTYLSEHSIDPEWQLLLVPFMKSDVFREKMDDALKKGFFQYPIKKQLPENGLSEMLKLVNDKFSQITQEHVDMFFTVAFEQGYFSHAAGENVYCLPNRNIELILRLQFEKYFDE